MKEGRRIGEKEEQRKGTEGRREGVVKKRNRGKGGQGERLKRTEGRREGGVKQKRSELRKERMEE